MVVVEKLRLWLSLKHLNKCLTTFSPMNYAHNNLRLKEIQFKIEKTLKVFNRIKSALTPSKQVVELEVKGKSASKYNPVTVK